MPEASPTTTALARRWPNRIRILRQERGLKARELAVLAGVTRTAVSRYERGLVVPGLRICVALAQALGVEVTELGFIEQVRERMEHSA